LPRSPLFVFVSPRVLSYLEAARFKPVADDESDD
jgi:hypothetical protein